MVEIYLNFNGNAAEAVELYRNAFKATNVIVKKYKDIPPSKNFSVSVEMMDKIVHAEMMIDGCKFHISDTQRVPVGRNINILVSNKNKDYITDAYNLLIKGGKSIVPLKVTAFSENYANLIDKYGNGWQLNHII